MIPFNKVNYKIQKVRSHLKSEWRNSKSSIDLNDRFTSIFYQSIEKTTIPCTFHLNSSLQIDKPEKNLQQSYECLYLC